MFLPKKIRLPIGILDSHYFDTLQDIRINVGNIFVSFAKKPGDSVIWSATYMIAFKNKE